MVTQPAIVSVIDSLLLIVIMTVLLVQVSTSGRDTAISSATSWKHFRESHVINRDDSNNVVDDDDDDEKNADDEQSGNTESAIGEDVSTTPKAVEIPERWSPAGTRRHKRAKDDGVCELEIFCGSGGRGDDRTSSGVVRLPIRGQRGPPGPPGPPGERGPRGTDGNGALTGGSNTVITRKVAFFAGLSDNMGPVTENSDVKFDRLVTNVGGGFNTTSGRFTAPVDGVYQFNVVISAQGRQKAAVMVVKNGEMVTTVWAESVPSWATSSNVAILQLQKNDRVWLILLSRASYLHGYMYTTFSGFIVFET